ncbi:ABC transporter ATP-binding protein [Streptococcus panodentis]|uniref:Multidrug ABC transporter permease n=1 Tax=Streptococcus panodentis TaxID=1581472 RepID=A0ABS5AVT9_9STRE|nr:MULTISPECIES: ABC transporter ATP-binding protein [Streptococcus]KXT85280.1 Lipid A export ATP-binding/permease protein MsbA [Streptococcus sp. DD11]MBP2620680.1 multidrug ABC transporter permease [Streptococcus panodentis]
MKTAAFFWSYFRKYKLSFAVVIMAIILSTVLQALFPIYMGQAVTELVKAGTAYAEGTAADSPALFAGFMAVMWNLGLAVIFYALGNLLYMSLMSRVIAHSTNDMRKGLFAKLSKMTVAFFDSHQDGDILSRFTSDLDNILQALNESLIQVMSNAALYLGLIAVMFLRNTTLAWVTVASTPVAFLVLWIIVRLARKYTDLQQKEVGRLNAYMDETISGQKAVIVQGLQEEVIQGFIQQNDKVRSATFKGRAFSGMLFPIMNGMSLINTAIVIFLGSALVLNDPSLETSVALGLVVTFAQFSREYYQPIIQVAASWGSLQLAFTGADRIQEMFDAPEEVRPEPAPAFTELRESVEISHVDFSYVEGKPVLRDVSISAPKGKMTAIVGPTGSGKSTIMNLVNRFYDVDGGRIAFDGRDIRDYELDSLRRGVGIVLQESVLFSGTIRDNIRFGVPDASQELVEAAARATHIHDYIESLPDQYDTLVDDDQNIFSTGQKQLISIARTLMTDPQVLILDEATSNVDTVTESKIQHAMEAIVAGRTSFVIAHRLKTILNADQIIVLKDGQVIEQGTHKELLQLDGFYAELYHNQFVFE